METLPSKAKLKMKNGFKFDKLAIQAFRTVCLILLYYCFSIGITFYQKWFIKGFHYPLTVVFCHLIIKFLLSSIARNLYTVVTGVNRVTLHCTGNAKKLAMTGIASALDIGFSNWSFEFITVSLYTMTKSTCIIFILIFALIFGLEKKRVSLIAIVLLISVGLFMFTYHSTQFVVEGFLLVLSASFLGGLRWTLAQLVMQRHDIGLSNPIDMIYHVQPWMMLGLFPLVIWFEGIPTINKSAFLEKLNENNVLFILLGSMLAFFMELSEYLLLSYTSSLTLSIAGIFKEIFTLYLAVEYYGDQMNFINFIGLVVCLTGISLHVTLKALDASGKVIIRSNILLLTLSI
ncbi:solute carrier-like protein [Dinothrombium tinctorium]|uniref:Solute carrier-like protein n=1 Tax=Dinothrombium tinctorium TaxID=1965070 RepID=A0A3S3QM46_9ACAR|nr:solute carrier-like protein [Dinothrombium tinctorium]